MEEDIAKTYPALVEWLKRSNHRPFSLKATYDIKKWISREISVPWNRSLDLLLFEHRHRWEILEITLPSSSVALFYAQDPVNFPQLKKLALRDDEYVDDTVFNIGEAPKLEALYFDGEYENENFLLIDNNIPPSVRHLSLSTMKLEMGAFRPTGITSLYVCDTLVSLDDFAKFPDFFPLLEALEVTFCIDPRDFVLPRTFVVLQNLRTLITSILHPFPVAYITAPNLKHLSIKRTLHDDATVLGFSDVVSFIKRSGSRLETFRNNAVPMAHEELVSFLDMVPSLEELEIFNTPIPLPSLMALILPTSAQSSESTSLRCPALSALVFDSVSTEGKEEIWIYPNSEILCSLLATRCVADPPSKCRLLEWLGLPLESGELALLRRDFPYLNSEAKMYSALEADRIRNCTGISTP